MYVNLLWHGSRIKRFQLLQTRIIEVICYERWSSMFYDDDRLYDYNQGSDSWRSEKLSWLIF